MCWREKTRRIRRINQLSLEAISVGKPNLPSAIYGLGSNDLMGLLARRIAPPSG
jgi:hypothetical protein